MGWSGGAGVQMAHSVNDSEFGAIEEVVQLAKLRRSRPFPGRDSTFSNFRFLSFRLCILGCDLRSPARPKGVLLVFQSIV